VAGLPACEEEGSAAWPKMEASRPRGVAPEKWRGLFEYVVWRLLLLLEPGHAGCFLADLCDPRRFDGLPLQAVTAVCRFDG